MHGSMGTDRSNKTLRMAPGATRAVLRLQRRHALVVDGPDRGATVDLGPSVVVGRDGDCDLVLSDSSVSGRHARLAVTNEGCWLEDLGSTNGVAVNGVVVQRARLEPGDRFVVGATTVQVAVTEADELVTAGAETSLDELVGTSQAMRLLFAVVRRVAPTELAVLVQGETGTGKELLAAAIHRLSRRRPGPFVAVDAASLSEHLAPSELFGHERGAFTGAERLHHGAFERASGGTLFLDEVGELRPDVQAQLLRVLETGTFNRLGGEKTLAADVRLVAATHRPLHELARQGTFRQDLLYRLDQVSVTLPPLRERRDDIPLLVERLTARLAESVGRAGEDLSFAPAALAALAAHSWPGNVRELRNVVGQALALAPASVVQVGDLPPLAAAPAAEPSPADDGPGALETTKVTMIKAALERHGGNRSAAARDLGVAVSTFHDWCRRYGL